MVAAVLVKTPCNVHAMLLSVKKKFSISKDQRFVYLILGNRKSNRLIQIPTNFDTHEQDKNPVSGNYTLIPIDFCKVQNKQLTGQIEDSCKHGMSQ